MLPGTFFLPIASLWSSLLAFVAAIFVISFFIMNYSFLELQHSPSDGISRGGVYHLVQLSLNRTCAFIASWALGLAYLSCFALNTKALALLTRNVLEGLFSMKFHVYLIQDNILLIDMIVILLCLALFAYISIRGVRRISNVMTIGALILLGGIVTMFVASHLMPSDAGPLPDLQDQPADTLFTGFISVFVLIPWAYVGYDSVIEIDQQINFPTRHMVTVMILAVLAATLAYAANIFTAIRGIPGDITLWIRHLNESGQIPVSASYTVLSTTRQALGRSGSVIFYLTALSSALTGMIGFSLSASSIVSHLSEDHLLPPVLSQLDSRYGTPRNAIISITTLAFCMIFFLSSMSFIEEIASFATTIGYCLVSLSALRMAHLHKKNSIRITGLLGVLLCLIWIILMLIRFPGLHTAVSKQTIFGIAIWTFLGIAIYSVFTRKK